MRTALKSVPGVRNVEVSFPNKEAVVTADKQGFDTKPLLDALSKAGYPGSVKPGP